MTMLMSDSNGRAIPALAPRSGGDVALTPAGATVLAADGDKHRAVRILASSDDVYIGAGETADYPQKMMNGVAEFIKLEPNFTLYAKGSGNLNIVVLG